MKSKHLWADLALLFVAIIWGGAFVAQRLGMTMVGPFTFNAARFALGGFVLLPFVLRARHRDQAATWWDGIVLGGLLFGGSTLQQIGLIYTSAGKAGFITGLYVVLVPLLLALGWRERIGWRIWLGAGLATAGLFLLSIQRGSRLAPGDGWVLAGALFWALHVIAVGKLAPGRNPLRLAMTQYFTCVLLGLPFIIWRESPTLTALSAALPAIGYVGLLSTALAYTVQVVGQRYTRPAHAAIILSGESVFAATFGWLLLDEQLTPRQWLGSAAILSGMLLAQWGASQERQVERLLGFHQDAPRSTRRSN